MTNAISGSARFQRAVALIDAANAADPNRDEADGRNWPKELLYAHRMSEMLDRFAPAASEAVRLACRAQHVERWKIPRSDYPRTPEGYKLWRTTLYRFHAEAAARLMADAGYDEETIERVKKIVGKRGLKVNPETQALEDVAGLVFIEHYMSGFATQHPEYDETKWLDIVRKTWRKMSSDSHTFALSGKLELPDRLVPLIVKATRGVP